MKQTESRKEFLKRCSYFIPSIFAIGIFSKGCDTGGDKTVKKDETKTGQCDDPSQLSEEQIAKRKKFNYVEEASVKNKSCQHCNLFLPNKENPACGTCILFNGPVRPGGTCTYFAPKAEETES